MKLSLIVQRGYSNGLTLNMEFISRVGQNFFFIIFTTAKHWWKYWNIPSQERNKFNIYHQTIEFPAYYIFFGFWTCFCQVLGAACNTWRDVTVWKSQHVKIIFFSLDETRYITAENVIHINSDIYLRGLHSVGSLQ